MTSLLNVLGHLKIWNLSSSVSGSCNQNKVYVLINYFISFCLLLYQTVLFEFQKEKWNKHWKVIHVTMLLSNFKSRKRASLLPALFFLFVLLSNPAAANDDDDDYIENVDDSEDVDDLKNCFSLVDESSWSRILSLHRRSGVLDFRLNNTGLRVITCLRGKKNFLHKSHLIRARRI